MALQARVPPGILALMEQWAQEEQEAYRWHSNAQDPRVQELATSVAAATRQAAEAAARAAAEAAAVSAVSRVFDKYERRRCTQASWRQQWSCCSWQRRCSSAAQSAPCHWGCWEATFGAVEVWAQADQLDDTEASQ